MTRMFHPFSLWKSGKMWSRVLNTTSQVTMQQRTVSSSSNVLTTLDLSTGIAVVSLNRPPVNALSLEFFGEIREKITELENNKEVKGLIFTSELPKVFSGGVELQEMYKGEEGRMREFWVAFQDLWHKVYSCRLPTASAINGHAMAGALAITTCTDYRVMVRGNATIGLNEARFGLLVPFWFMDSFVGCVGQRQAEMAMLTGSLFSPDDAMRIGIVDELADDKVDAISRCQRQLVQFTKCDQNAFALSKLQLRKTVIDRFLERRTDETEEFVRNIQRPEMQKKIGDYLDSIQKKKGKK